MERIVNTAGFFEKIDEGYKLMGNRATYNAKSLLSKVLKGTIDCLACIGVLYYSLWSILNIEIATERANNLLQAMIDANNFWCNIISNFI